MAKKIKKRVSAQKKKPAMQESERIAVFVAVAVILVVDVLLFLTVFPIIDDKSFLTTDYGSGGILVFKIIMIMVVDIALFIISFLAVSRRVKPRRIR